MDLRILGLSKKEEQVLHGVQRSPTTPLIISRDTKISRPAIYAILKNLKKRGLIASRIVGGKKEWLLAPERDIEETIYSAKRALLKIPEGRKELGGVPDSSVVIHRGAPAIRRLMRKIFLENKEGRLYGFQGDVVTDGWDKIFSVEETNEINRAIKKNNIIVEVILPEGWFEEQAKELGIGWAQDFEGRMTRVNIVSREYFNHGGHVFIFKNCIYLSALLDELVIEIHNTEIQKMLLAFFLYMQKHSHIIDANELLRKLIAQNGLRGQV